MDEFKVHLPDVDVLFHVKHHILKADRHDILIVAGGRKPDNNWLQYVVAGGRKSDDKWVPYMGVQRKVFCADKGVEYCISNDLLPYLLFGDQDSTQKKYYDDVAARGTIVKTFPSLKDDTDLQLVLNEIPENATSIVATGIWGGRYDHLFSNVYSLLTCQDRLECPILLADEQELMILLQDTKEVKLNFLYSKKVEAISILPLSASATVSIDGVYWPLDKEVVSQTKPYAISNQLADVEACDEKNNKIQCICHQGKIGLYIKWHTV